MAERDWIRLGWWWNRSWGTGNRRDVWLDYHEADQMFRVRWREGQDEEDVRTAQSATLVIRTLKALLGEDKSHWQEKIYLDADGTVWRHDRPLEVLKARWNPPA